jgi:preprotein translocase subunit SecE
MTKMKSKNTYSSANYLGSKNLELSAFLNILNWGGFLVLFIFGLGQYYFLKELVSYSNFVKFVVLLVSCAAGFYLFAYKTNEGRGLLKLWSESVNELNKVFWPSRKEALTITGIVLLLVSTLAVILWMIDAILLKIVTLIVG